MSEASMGTRGKLVSRRLIRVPLHISHIMGTISDINGSTFTLKEIQ